MLARVPSRTARRRRAAARQPALPAARPAAGDRRAGDRRHPHRRARRLQPRARARRLDGAAGQRRGDLLRPLGVPALPAVRRGAPGRARPRRASLRYARRRALRILPAYWVALIVLGAPRRRAHARRVRRPLVGLLRAAAELERGDDHRRHRRRVEPQRRDGVLHPAAVVRAAMARARCGAATATGRRGWSSRCWPRAPSLAVVVRGLVHALWPESVFGNQLPGTWTWFAGGLALAVASAWLAPRPLAARPWPARFATEHPLACWGIAFALLTLAAWGVGLAREPFAPHHHASPAGAARALRGHGGLPGRARWSSRRPPLAAGDAALDARARPGSGSSPTGSSSTTSCSCSRSWTPGCGRRSRVSVLYTALVSRPPRSRRRGQLLPGRAAAAALQGAARDGRDERAHAGARRRRPSPSRSASRRCRAASRRGRCAAPRA